MAGLGRGGDTVLGGLEGRGPKLLPQPSSLGKDTNQSQGGLEVKELSPSCERE